MPISEQRQRIGSKCEEQTQLGPVLRRVVRRHCKRSCTTAKLSELILAVMADIFSRACYGGWYCLYLQVYGSMASNKHPCCVFCIGTAASRSLLFGKVLTSGSYVWDRFRNSRVYTGSAQKPLLISKLFSLKPQTLTKTSESRKSVRGKKPRPLGLGSFSRFGRLCSSSRSSACPGVSA